MYTFLQKNALFLVGLLLLGALTAIPAVAEHAHDDDAVISPKAGSSTSDTGSVPLSPVVQGAVSTSSEKKTPAPASPSVSNPTSAPTPTVIPRVRRHTDDDGSGDD